MRWHSGALRPLAMERDGCGLGHTAMEREYRCWLGHTARGGTRRVRVRAHRCRCCRKAGGRHALKRARPSASRHWTESDVLLVCNSVGARSRSTWGWSEGEGAGSRVGRAGCRVSVLASDIFKTDGTALLVQMCSPVTAQGSGRLPPARVQLFAANWATAGA